MLCNPIKNFVHESPLLVLISAIGSLILLLALAVYRHQHPINLYLLFGFTLLESLSVATAVSFYEYTIVLQAFVLTSAVFLGLTAYTFQSKRDFSKLGASQVTFLFQATFHQLRNSVLQLFFYNDTMELVFAGAGALLFCGFIIFDTHLLMHKLSPEEHVLASINLYLDIVNLFIYILRILDSMKKH
uniref:Transmembrane BAX inhibitor motif containing 4 n=1 Tax=Cyprinus carpio TaxID=7962 RepID=A0A8C1W0Q0_CYPCA